MSTATPPRLLFAGGASPISTSVDISTIALTQARARGIHTHLINRPRSLAATPEVNRLADEVTAVDADDPGACARWVRERAARGDRFDMVLGLRDTVQLSVADAAAVFGAPGNPADAVRRVRNKDACRAALAAAGFPQPAVRLCASADEAAAFLADGSGPWVVKPRDAAGSIGVRKVTGVEELPAAVRALPDPDLFLVEEFVEGPEYSVEGVFLGGVPKVLAVTAKMKLPPPYFVEIGHVLPAGLPGDVLAGVEQQVTGALTALGLRFGVFHAELWLTREGVVLGEVHPRPGGDWIHRLLEHAVPGLELFGLLFDDLLGRPVNENLTPVRAAASYFLTAPPGRLTRVEGWAEVAAHPAVLHAELGVRPGDVVGPVRQSADRVGALVVGADSPEQARELALGLAASVRFEVEPAGGRKYV
ncbi:ATP-grasp domain-containing protein [Microbispora bryophytorum]|uniref:ATP-grasp domain-containing protein n=1 Tax=Microbispora bryophytorum TaxID=1460882 RepID=UPI0033F17578